MKIENERILVLAKTYPSPSASYVETSCIAGMTAKGKFLRLYPIPFRFLKDEQRFKKWQWIASRISKARKDHRPESCNIEAETINPGPLVPYKNKWDERRKLLSILPPPYLSFEKLEMDRQEHSVSLALLRPARILKLEIEKVKTPEWTEEEIDKLLRSQCQTDIFSSNDERKELTTLRKLPHKFYYVYEDEGGTRRHKIIDWEAGALYWNCVRRYGKNWEEKFRFRYEDEFLKKDILFFMGNQHRFPDQWLIISVIPLPKEAPKRQIVQPTLFPL